jgi:hypothetical protein
MPRVANPLTKVRKRLEPCCFGPANFKNLPKDKDKASDPDKHLKLYRKAVPIQREIVPKVDEALDLACERLGLDRETVHGFVESDPSMNAYCQTNIRGNAVVCVNSGVVERLTMNELAYIFGHELGHYILPMRKKHVILKNGAVRPASMEDAVEHRKLEISMDRFGLVACQDLQVACSAAIKVASGLGSAEITSDVIAFTKEAVKGYVRDYTEYEDEAYSSHPAAYARIRSLYHFSQSEDYLAIIGRKGGRPHSDVDAEVQKDLEATLDYFAGRLMSDAIARFSHFFAALHVDQEGSKAELSRHIVSRQPVLDAEMVVGLVGQIKKIPAEHKEKATFSQFDDILNMALDRCPRAMNAHLEELLPRLHGTKVAALTESFAKVFRKEYDGRGF